MSKLRRSPTSIGGRCYLAGTMLFRGDDAERLAYLDNLATQMKVRLVATNDVHYHVPDRRALQDVVTAIRLNCTVEELGFHRFASPSGTEIAGRDGAAVPQVSARDRAHREIVDALHNSRSISSPISIRSMYEGGETPMQKLERLTWKGAARRYPKGVPDEVATELQQGVRAHREQEDRALLPDGARDRREGARDGHPLPRARIGRQFRRLLLPAASPRWIPTRAKSCSSASCPTSATSRPISTSISSMNDAKRSSSGSTRRKAATRAALAATVIAYRSRSAIRDVGKALGLSPDTLGVMADTVWGMRRQRRRTSSMSREAGLDPTIRVWRWRSSCRRH